jgi:hypothetical protein
LPEQFGAERAVSVSPRGLARHANRPYRAIFAADSEAMSALGELPFAGAKQIRSPAALLRYLDASTCPGCHQSRAIAGFHLLGEERDAHATFNALAVGVSPHFAGELAWREDFVRRLALPSVADGGPPGPPRPFAERTTNDGEYGAHCGLGDPGFSDWKCAPELWCRNVNGDEIGICAPEGGNTPGDACQNARIEEMVGPGGDRVEPEPQERCRATSRTARGTATCTQNHFGFAGGMCSEACTTLGEVRADTICAAVPLSGFENECFVTREPIEPCVEKYAARLRVRACSSEAPCRDDFACARVPGAPMGVGACVPPYFLFQARVDGPRLDR